MDEKQLQITLRWRKDKKDYEKGIDRASFYAVMDGIRKGFSDDNEISSFFCDNIIGQVDKIFIDKDRIEQIDEPFIQYEIGNEKRILKIIRYHKIIWAILDGYCKM